MKIETLLAIKWAAECIATAVALWGVFSVIMFFVPDGHPNRVIPIWLLGTVIIVAVTCWIIKIII